MTDNKLKKWARETAPTLDDNDGLGRFAACAIGDDGGAA